MKSKVWILHINNDVHDNLEVFGTHHEGLDSYIGEVAWLMPPEKTARLRELAAAGEHEGEEWEAIIEEFVKAPSEYSLQEYDLDLPIEKIVVEVRGGVAYCDNPDVEIIDYD